jgi:hypothetical protein
MPSTRYSSQISMELDISLRNFEESSDIKFHKDSSSGNPVIPYRLTDGWTDRHEEATSAFHNLANAPKKAPCLVKPFLGPSEVG